MMRLRGGGATDVGLVRTANEDQLLIADPLYAVADGMGGAAGGEVASQLAVEALAREFEKSAEPTAANLVASTRAANRAVWDHAVAEPRLRGMGTTLVALVLTDSEELAAINIGDSRLYHYHEGELRQVTADHNLVAEMVLQGRITKEQAEVHPRRNVITRVVGVDPEVAVDLFVEPALVGDRYVLCSDGLPREVSDDFIAAMLGRLADPTEAAQALVDEALRAGGNDNITVVVVDVIDSPTDLEPPAPPAGEDERDDEDEGDGDPTAVALGTPDPQSREADPPPPPKKRHRRASLRSRGARARRGRTDSRPTARFFTLRVVAFVVAVIVVLAAGAAAIAWYARSGWFVKLEGQNLAIYQGRPGGVLWIQPTVAETTRYTTDDVLPVHLPELRSGVQESSLDSSRQYVQRLVEEKAAADRQLQPVTVPTTTPTTRPTTTTQPTRQPTTTQPTGSITTTRAAAARAPAAIT